MKAKAQKVGSNRGALQAAALAVAVALSAGYSSQAAAQNKGGGGSTSSAAGVITIDQARAEAGGVTPGDAPGFPVTISRPGSYRLVSNLTVADPNTDAIQITSGDVTLDLGGFAITGPVLCTGSPHVTCGAPGQGDGIAVEGAGSDNVAISNGTIRGMSRYGIYVQGGGVLIDRLRVNRNHAGMYVFGGLVTHSVVDRNGGSGITGALLNVQSSVVSRNNGWGLNPGSSVGYGNNIFAGNALGSVNHAIVGSVPVDGNLCDGTLCQ